MSTIGGAVRLESDRVQFLDGIGSSVHIDKSGFTRLVRGRHELGGGWNSAIRP
jgi:hypothetical protein